MERASESFWNKAAHNASARRSCVTVSGPLSTAMDGRLVTWDLTKCKVGPKELGV
jgi:hypothetical protein